MRRNETNYSTKLSDNQYINLLQSELSECLSESFLDELARKNGFIQRSGKIRAPSFVKSLVFNREDHDSLSLLDLKCDFINYENCNVSREAIHKRFNPEAVAFLKDLVSKMITSHLGLAAQPFAQSCCFNGIYLKDSTKFKLPAIYFNNYPGYGGHNHELSSLMNIQYEYDLLSGNWTRLELTQATRNDQTESRETVDDIRPGSLNIRDLGYITATYLSAVQEKGAYYLNRLPKVGVFIMVEGKYQPLDWEALDRKMKKANLPHLEYEVYLGEGKIQSRMVLSPVPEQVANERVRKAARGGKRTSKGYQVSKEYKTKARYNIFITNVPKEILPNEQVVDGYRLRWQVELIFKAWKSNMKVHKIKPMKRERMECQLLGKFIWILLSSKLLQAAEQNLKRPCPNQTCSLFKFLKRIKEISQQLRVVIFNRKSFINWYTQYIVQIIPYLTVEQRLNKPSSNQVLNQLFMKLS